MHPFRRLTLSLLFIATVGAPSSALAQVDLSLRDLYNARTLSMGGAFRALAHGTEVIDGNPAGLAARRRYLLEISGGYDPNSDFGFGGLSALDSTTSFLSAGVSYRYVADGGRPFRRGHLATVGMAVPLSSRISLGVSGKYLKLNGLDPRNGITADAGLLIRIAEAFGISVSGHNLIDMHVLDFRPYFAAGVGYAAGPLAVAFDMRADFASIPGDTRLTYHGGAELFLGKGIPIRAGFERDQLTRSSFWSAGFGLADTGGGLDFAYRHEIGSEQSRLFLATLRVVMN
jgi:hypothetical protein